MLTPKEKEELIEDIDLLKEEIRWNGQMIVQKILESEQLEVELLSLEKRRNLLLRDLMEAEILLRDETTHNDPSQN